LRENVCAPSVVETTFPPLSSRYPAFAEGNARAFTEKGHDVSLGANGGREKLSPPSSERRTAQPPPATILFVSPPTKRIRGRSTVRPVTMPAQVAPPSVLFSTVPESPDA